MIHSVLISSTEQDSMDSFVTGGSYGCFVKQLRQDGWFLSLEDLTRGFRFRFTKFKNFFFWLFFFITLYLHFLHFFWLSICPYLHANCIAVLASSKMIHYNQEPPLFIIHEFERSIMKLYFDLSIHINSTEQNLALPSRMIFFSLLMMLKNNPVFFFSAQTLPVHDVSAIFLLSNHSF